MQLRIRNTTGEKQAIVWKNKQIVMQAHEEGLFDAPLAEAFLERLAPAIINVSKERIGKVVETEVKRRRIYIANMTGNPDAPDTIEARVWENKRWGSHGEPNALKTPMQLTEMLEGPQTEYTDKYGYPAAFNMVARAVSVPPYTRAVMDEGIGLWFLNRCYLSTPSSGDSRVVKAIECRPPHNFEPDIDWSLDDMRAYLQLADPNATLGPTEAEIHTANAEDEDAAEAALRDASLLCWRRIYFRLVDSKYRLPSKSEFDVAVGTKKAAVKKGTRKVSEEDEAFVPPVTFNPVDFEAPIER